MTITHISSTSLSMNPRPVIYDTPEERRWERKSKADYSLLLHLRQHFPSWKSFYHHISSFALYHLTGSTDLVTNNIEDAYKNLLHQISLFFPDLASHLPPLEQADQLSTLLRGRQHPNISISLHLAVEGIPITIGDPSCTLFWFSHSEDVYICQNLMQYPRFSTTGVFRNVMKDQNKSMMTRLDRFQEDDILFPVMMVNGDTSIFYRIPTDKNLFARLDMPAIILAERDFAPQIAIIPKIYRKHLIQQNNSTASIDKITSLLPEIFDRLDWEPVENLANYPSE